MTKRARPAPGDHVDRILAQWRDQRPDVDCSPMGVTGRIKRLATLCERATRDNFARHGLEPWEFDVLATLRCSGPPHRLSAGQLGRTLMITSGTVTHRLDRLEKAKLVRRVDDPQDRRGVLIELTPEGLHRADSVLEHHLRTERALLGCLTRSQQAALADLLRLMLVDRGDCAQAASGDAPRPRRRVSQAART